MYKTRVGRQILSANLVKFRRRNTIIAHWLFHKHLQSPLPGKNLQCSPLPWGRISQNWTNSVTPVRILLNASTITILNVCMRVWVVYLIKHFCQGSGRNCLLFAIIGCPGIFKVRKLAHRSSERNALVREGLTFDSLPQDKGVGGPASFHFTAYSTFNSTHVKFHLTLHSICFSFEKKKIVFQLWSERGLTVPESNVASPRYFGIHCHLVWRFKSLSWKLLWRLFLLYGLTHRKHLIPGNWYEVDPVSMN